MRDLKKVLWILAVCAAGFLFLRLSAPRKVQESSVAVTDGVSASEPLPAHSDPIPLIRGGESTDVPWMSRTPAAKRVRKIFPDPSWMTPDPVLKVGDRITLALFDDVVLDAELINVTRYPNGGTGMTAHLPEGRGTIYLSYCNGTMGAYVEVAGGADYMVRYRQDDGAYYAVEIDRDNSDVFEGAEPQIPPVQDAVADASALSGTTLSLVVTGAPSGSTIVDVMIVYTPAARTVEGGTNGINININLAMQKANEVHTNSDTQVYLNLVHSAEVNYTESGTNFSLDLSRLTNTGDGYLDEVHTLRNTYKADLICLFESNSVSGGLGWLLSTTNGDSSHAFCMARVQQSDWTYTVVHEWGHNMGCSHSKTQTAEPWSGKLYSYSAGWQWADTAASPKSGYCSVMTYEDFNSDGTNDYIRKPYFSNPNIFYVGNSTNATGNSTDGDNARTIRNMKTVLAGYQKAPDVDYDGLPNEWELQYFGGETNANPAAAASNGVNTLIEAYVAGISPVDPNAFFKMNSFSTPAVASNGFVIEWSVVTGRVYSVYRATNLLNSGSFQPLETNIVWPQSSYTDTVYSTQPNGFYNVKVQLAP